MAVSTIYSYGSSNRITGMYSGMDTDELVKNMLTVEQYKVNTVYQNKTKAEWKQQAYTDINKQVTDFTNKYMSNLSSDNMWSQGVYNAYTTTLSENNYISAEGTSSAFAAEYTILSATKATYAQVGGQYLERAEISTSSKLEEIVGGDMFGTDGTFRFKINDKEFSFDKSTTVAEMMDDVNESGIGVMMSYSQISNSFSIRSESTGADQSVKVENVDGFGTAFGGENSFFGVAAGEYKGSDASITFKVGDKEVTETSASNTFTLDGVKYTIKNDFKQDENGGPMSFEVKQDVDSVITKVKSFIDEYNKIVDSLYKKVSEYKDYDYEVLTEEEREALTEEEVEKWDAKSKEGLLRNDLYINNLLSSMRSALYQTVGDTGLSAASIGLQTGTWDKHGQIVLNEDKLRAALEKDPNAVAKVMAGIDNEDTASNENGFVSRIRETMTSFSSNMKNTVIKDIDEDISDYETKIEELMDKMYEKQESYYLMFAKMESLMQEYDSQAGYFSSMLGG